MTKRSHTLVIEQELITEECCHAGCGILFAMTAEFVRERRKDHAMWYCPNGHPQQYSGKNEEERLRAELEEERRLRQRAQQQIEYEAQIRRQETARADRERNRANGYKGFATRITKRAKAGVCPCCNRSFENLRRHMMSQHPTFTPMEIEQGAAIQ